MAEEPRLKQSLRHFQVFFIALSAIIGSGIVSGNGEALELSGPGGLILSVIIMGVISILFGECISELVQQFPAPNAIVEYVSVFVDQDLGWVVGIAYWYTYSSIFVTANMSAANMSRYWDLAQTWQTLAFYVLAPVCVVGINLFGVFTFGVVETIGGALKMCLVFGVSLALYGLADQDESGANSAPINDGIRNKEAVASNPYHAVCYAIPLVAYSTLGIEIFTVSAFETKYRRDLSWPPKFVAYVTFVLYLMCTIGQAMNVKWTNTHLPDVSHQTNQDTAGLPSQPSSTDVVVIAAWQAGHRNLAGFFNGCFIFSVLTQSNTSLYVASRTLYGLTRFMPANWAGRRLKTLSRVQRTTRVPAAALLFSAVAFFWLPFLQFKWGYSIVRLTEIMAVSASVSCLVVWAALCLAFIRYYYWLKKCELRLKIEYPQYCRGCREYKATTLFGWAQPLPAFLGLFGCLCVFAFTSATWWDTPVSLTKVAVAYSAQIVLFALFVIFKLINRRWWVKLDPDVAVLVQQLNRLRWLKQDELPSDVEAPASKFAGQSSVERIASGSWSSSTSSFGNLAYPETCSGTPF